MLQTTSVGIVAPATMATPGTAFNVVVGFNVQGAFMTPPTGNIILTATQPRLRACRDHVRYDYAGAGHGSGRRERRR